MTTRVLLADDDLVLAAMLTKYLAREGFSVTAVNDGEEAVRRALSKKYEIVVLDVTMPKVNGIEALRQIREMSRIPVLMLTARGDDVDRIAGLEIGADDYIRKPCMPRELVARLRAVLRRTERNVNAALLQAGSLKLWPEKRAVEWQGRKLPLTSIEFNVLEVLMRSAGRTVTKDEISRKALGRQLARFDRSVDVHVVAIRQKLGNGATLILTVYGQGYHLIKE